MKTKRFSFFFIFTAMLSVSLSAADDVNAATLQAVRGSAAAKTPGVISIKLGGHVGDVVNAVFEHRILGEDVAALVEPFRHKEEKSQWQMEFWGKWILGAADMYIYTRNQQLYEKMQASVAALLDTQQDDGYIGNYAPDYHLAQWDVWGRKYVVRGLLAWYDVSGDKAALDAACKEMDFLIKELAEKNKKIVETGNYRGMPSASILNAVVKLYQATNEKKYLDFANTIVADIESEQGAKLIEKALAGIHVAERFPHPDSWYSEANGQKAYEMMSCYEGLLDLYTVTQNDTYFKAARLAVDDIINTEINVAGSGSSHECWYGGKALQARPTFHTMETCVTTTWLQILNRLRVLTGESRYADLMEQTFFNALFASLKLDASRIAKYMPLEGVHTPGEQQCGMTTNCCNANGPRGFALIPKTAYTVNTAEITANFYAPSVAAINIGGKTTVELTQTGDYPKGNTVGITIATKKKTDFTLKLRIPAWSKATTVAVNGQNIEGVRSGTYFAITRTWQNGDSVSIDFDMNPRVVELTDCQAILWGPIALARDSRFGDGFVDEAINITNTNGGVLLTPTAAPEWAWMSFTAPAVLGLDQIDHGKAKNVLFCDFASAGNTWNPAERYRVWLPKSFDVTKAK